MDVFVTIAVVGLKVPNLVPRGRDPFGQRRGSVTPGDAVTPVIVFILYNRPEEISAQVKCTETSKVSQIEGFLQVNFPVSSLWVRGKDSFKSLRSES